MFSLDSLDSLLLSMLSLQRQDVVSIAAHSI